MRWDIVGEIVVCIFLFIFCAAFGVTIAPVLICTHSPTASEVIYSPRPVVRPLPEKVFQHD